MIVWILCLMSLTLTVGKCEPPVNSYLPPSSGSDGRPSPQYGTPGQNQGQFGGPNSSGQDFANRPSSYNPSGISSSPSTEYGAPNQFPSGSQGGGPRGSLGRGQSPVLGSQYNSPNQQTSFNSGFGPSRGRGVPQRPDSSYGTPNELQSSGRSDINSQQAFSGAPSSTYGTPEFGNNLNINENYRESGVDDSNKPVKYEFSYEVDNPDTGTMFGHSEQRNGDVATGEYNVLLPDGRKQVVEYEADQEGFKPQIRYEGIARGGGSSFGRGGGPGRNQGYPSASAGANAFSGSGVALPQFSQGDNGAQSGRYQQPDSGSSGYPSGRSSLRGLDRGDEGYADSQGAGDQGRKYPGSQINRGQNRGFGGAEGYPSGGPNGPRGSGY